MNDYQKGWLGALGVLKRDVDANPGWGAGDICDHIALLLDRRSAPGTPVAEMRVTAPADSPLGVELSKIRDRLNALETKPSAFALCVEALEVMHEVQIEHAAKSLVKIESALYALTASLSGKR